MNAQERLTIHVPRGTFRPNHNKKIANIVPRGTIYLTPTTSQHQPNVPRGTQY